MCTAVLYIIIRYLTLKNKVRENMVFIDRKVGVSVYGMHDDEGLGFRQLRRIRQIKQLGFKFIALKKYELAFYFILLIAFLFTVMTFAQILFFSISVAAFIWIVAAAVANPGQQFYYLKKDLKILKKTGSKVRTSLLRF
jgi:hypothetical protein